MTEEFVKEASECLTKAQDGVVLFIGADGTAGVVQCIKDSLRMIGALELCKKQLIDNIAMAPLPETPSIVPEDAGFAQARGPLSDAEIVS